MSRKSTIPAQRLPKPSVAERRGSTKSPHNCNADFVYDGGASDDGTGRRMFADSHLELLALWNLACHRDTADLFEQQAFSWVDRGGKAHAHFFDIVVQTRSGTLIAYAVRPEARIDRDYRDMMSTIREQAIAAGFCSDVRFLTETSFDAIDRHNAELLHGSRRPDQVPDDAARDVVNAMCGILTVGTLCDRICLGGAGFRAVVRLVRSRHLEMLRHERLEHSTQLIKKEKVQ